VLDLSPLIKISHLSVGSLLVDIQMDKAWRCEVGKVRASYTFMLTQRKLIGSGPSLPALPGLTRGFRVYIPTLRLAGTGAGFTISVGSLTKEDFRSQNRLNLTMYHNAATPSDKPIFLPCS